MKCPVCDVALSISSREGVEIDFCPQCRGVWLDRGELDKVIERASAAMVPTPDRGRPDERRDDRRSEPRYDDRRSEPRYEERRDDRRYDDRRPDDDHKRKKKKRSFLEDLFELD
jgi:Zn-finger nucleic acid-binding protein